jgi:hypothetical protein
MLVATKGSQSTHLGNNDVSGGVVLLDVEGSIEGCGDESWLGETD